MRLANVVGYRDRQDTPMTWEARVAEITKGHKERAEARIPEPLFESPLVGSRLCLRCGKAHAKSLLYSSVNGMPVLPLCRDCVSDWNFYGYCILKSIHPKSLIFNLVKFKIFHPLNSPSAFSLYNDIKNLLRWSNKMRKLKMV